MYSVFEDYYIGNFAERSATFNSVEFNEFCTHFQRVLPLAKAHRRVAVAEQAHSMAADSANDAYIECLFRGPVYPNQHWPIKRK